MIFQAITKKNCAGACPGPRLPHHSACMVSVKAPSNCLRYEPWLSVCLLNRWLDTSQTPNKVWEIYSLQLRNATSLKKKIHYKILRGETHTEEIARGWPTWRFAFVLEDRRSSQWRRVMQTHKRWQSTFGQLHKDCDLLLALLGTADSHLYS